MKVKALTIRSIHNSFSPFLCVWLGVIPWRLVSHLNRFTMHRILLFCHLFSSRISFENPVHHLHFRKSFEQNLEETFICNQYFVGLLTPSNRNCNQSSRYRSSHSIIMASSKVWGISQNNYKFRFSLMFLTHFFDFVGILGEGVEWDWIGKGIFRDLVHAAKTSPSSSEIGVDPPFLVIIIPPSSPSSSSVYLSVVISTSSRIPSVKGSQRLTIWIIHRLRDSNYSSSLSTARDSLPLSHSSLVSPHFSDLSIHPPQSPQSLTNSPSSTHLILCRFHDNETVRDAICCW